VTSQEVVASGAEEAAGDKVAGDEAAGDEEGGEEPLPDTEDE
jgi:hypothetical protein